MVAGTVLIKLLKSPFIAIVAALVLTIIVIQCSSAQQSFVLDSKVHVTVSVVGKDVHIYVSLPGPTPYYYYYQYYNYTTYPVKVLVLLEKLENDVHVLVDMDSIELYAYGSPHSGEVVFENLASGTYHVKVLFWNDFLSLLALTGGGWIPYAHPYTENVTVGG